MFVPVWVDVHLFNKILNFFFDSFTKFLNDSLTNFFKLKEPPPSQTGTKIGFLHRARVMLHHQFVKRQSTQNPQLRPAYYGSAMISGQYCERQYGHGQHSENQNSGVTIWLFDEIQKKFDNMADYRNSEIIMVNHGESRTHLANKQSAVFKKIC